MTIITRRRASAALCLLLLSGQAGAVDLPLPSGAQTTLRETEEGAAYRLPTGRWAEGDLPVTRIDGTVTRMAWRIGGRDLTPLQLMSPIRNALESAGWEIVLDCESAGCGGFDFRFAAEVLPAPAMYVDLTNFRFLSARAPSGEAAGVLTSRDGPDGYVQIIRAVPRAPVAPPGGLTTDAESLPDPDTPADVVARLETTGHAILRDLRFESGSTTLGDGAVASLDAIAAFLEGRPDLRVLLVGHTDATGSLAANRAISRSRAEAAAAYLRERHGIAAARVGAEGAGYLAPVASNLDAEGRARNRRVEAILLPLE